MDDILDKEQNQNKKRGFNTKIIYFIGLCFFISFFISNYFYDLKYRWLLYFGIVGFGISLDILKYFIKNKKQY